MKPSNKVILIRHGATEANLNGRFLGQLDLPLSDTGKRQARLLEDAIQNINPRAIFSSPLKRSVETAELAASQLGAKVMIEPDLREADFGKWDNKTFEEVKREFEKEAMQWLRGDVDFTFPGGESLMDFLQRVRGVIMRLLELSPGPVAAFTHGGVIGLGICQLLELPPSRHVQFRLPPASITTIEMFEGRGVLTGIWQPPGVSEA